MSEDKELRAREIYNDLIDMLVEDNWKFDRFDDDMVIKSGLKRDDDLPIDFLIFVLPDRELIQFISVLPFKAKEDMRIELSLAVNAANYGFTNGSFDYDMRDGEIRFRMSQSYMGCQIGREFFEFMIYYSLAVVTRYSSKFFALNKGYMNLNDFISDENSNRNDND